jgi:hypothetical protein
LACGPRTGGRARVRLGSGGGVPVGCGSTKGMTAGPQLSVTEAEAGSSCGGLAAELGRKANWAAATLGDGGCCASWAGARESLGCHSELGHNHELLLLGCWAR